MPSWSSSDSDIPCQALPLQKCFLPDSDLTPFSPSSPSCCAITSSSCLCWHPCRGLLTLFGLWYHMCIRVSHVVGCFLHPAWAWVSCDRQPSLSRCPSHPSCALTAWSWPLQLPLNSLVVDSYIPLPLLMTSGLYFQERKGIEGEERKKHWKRRMKRQ